MSTTKECEAKSPPPRTTKPLILASVGLGEIDCWEEDTGNRLTEKEAEQFLAFLHCQDWTRFHNQGMSIDELLTAYHKDWLKSLPLPTKEAQDD